MVADQLTAQSLSPALDYHLSEEALNNAEAELRGSDLIHWSHHLYLSSQGQPIEVLYCRNRDWAQTVASSFAREMVLGMDIEWEYGPKTFLGDIRDVKNHVSLIQIASESKIALFHVALFQGNTPDELMPAALKDILTSETVMKAGVNIGGDATRISGAFGFDCKGLVELSHTYRLVTYSNDRPELVNRKLVSLSTQVEDVLGYPLRKDDVRMSSWSKHLNKEQQHYAAADAYAGFRLYHALEDARLSMSPVPPRPAFYEKGETVLLANGQVPPKNRRTASVPADVTDTAQNPKMASEPSCDAESNDPDSSRMDAGELADGISELASGDPRIVAVDEWVSEYRAERVKRNVITAKRASLRVYGLWHQHGLSPAELAVLLRDPPLKQSTINSYIIEAVAYDKDLPRDPARLRTIKNSVPDYVLKRYKGLATWWSTI
ncbi:ribonuclease H-like domain-containing protein [Elsinoe ampelina]|uniref:Ribonuclease H-like domain-containing protein n=1 Tax=Elsinoe ampelina TaxID=302913 RepID=A0A6A6G9C9_9PEZI|nr:ribonuclease H-like domain-containing protein [Elsinoe ampelina]